MTAFWSGVIGGIVGQVLGAAIVYSYIWGRYHEPKH